MICKWLRILQAYLIVCALEPSFLHMVEYEFKVNIPIVKYFFCIFDGISVLGLSAVLQLSAFLVLYVWVDKQDDGKISWWMRVCAIFFGCCTTIGRSYHEMGNWDYVFHGRMQFALALFITVGYIFAYELGIRAFKQLWIRAISGEMKWREGSLLERVQTLLFEKRPFGASFIWLFVTAIPYMIAYFPGALQWDAHRQLWEYTGVMPWSGHHPIFMTWLEGQCLNLSRILFGMDSMGLFFYVFPQIIIQYLVFAYVIKVICKTGCPYVLRWISFVYFWLMPSWKSWGYTVVKDTYYYIGILLLVAVTVDVWMEKKGARWWQLLLFFVSGVMVTLSRNNGRHLLLVCVLFAVLTIKKLRISYLIVAMGMVLSIVTVDYGYASAKGIADGPVREMLSIPIQQMARCMTEYTEEVPDEDRQIWIELFGMDIDQMSYNPELSDNIKNEFIEYPTNEEMRSFLDLWWRYMRKYPSTYAEALLNHIYGYFYPARGWLINDIGDYYIGNTQHWRDGYLDMKFAIENNHWRDLERESAQIIAGLPVVSMVFSPGMHTYIVILVGMYLLYKRRIREMVVLLPAIMTILICLLSPANAYIRYMFPIMVTLPLSMVWCWYNMNDLSIKEDRVNGE